MADDAETLSLPTTAGALGKGLDVKVLHVISSGGMYGAEAVILNMSRTLDEGQHSSSLGVFYNSSNPNIQLHEAAVREGIESHLIPCTGRMDRTVSTSIRRLARMVEADIVHAHGYKADIYSYFGLRSTGIPFISTCHTWYDNDWKVFLYGVADRIVLHRFSGIVAVSDEVRLQLLKAGVNPEKTSLINNGIDLRPFDHPSPVLKDELGWNGFPLAGLVGRLSKEKGVDIFLTACSRVLEQVPEAKFVVIGDGPDATDLDALIDKLGIRASVRMIGRRNDMPSVYASLDLMVSASRREGLPMAILEGMASRLPVVATAVGEVPKLVKNMQTGLLVPKENPELLAFDIVRLLRDSSLRDSLGSAARRLVEDEFSAERMTADYLRMYESAITRAEEAGREWVHSHAAR
jgi:glycosyltransferase involved in cell wall biosynthesis